MSNINIKVIAKVNMERSLTISTWNMENLDNEDSVAWNARKLVLRPMLERTKADILLLQEVNSIEALNELRLNTHYASHEIAHTTTQSGSPYDVRNLVVLSRFPIIEINQYMNDKVSAPIWKKVTAIPPEEPKKVSWERPILYVKIKLSNQKILYVVNLHLKSLIPTPVNGQIDPNDTFRWLTHGGWAEGFYVSSIKRVGQALETRLLIDEIFSQEDEHSLIVVGGDFNAEIGDVSFKTIVGSVEDTSNISLRPSVLVPCELNVPPDQRFSLLHKGRGNMLDHVIVSQEFYAHWIETRIFNELLHDESTAFFTDDKFPESDHAPVNSYFSVPTSWIT
jgi:endonuclease/exonuclease/phosphatase family metal-dependent hydrolase